MTVVTSRIVTTGGRPVPGVYVYAWLVATSTALSDGARVDERTDTYTDRDGRWSLPLPPASGMTDQDALWRIRETGYDAYLVRVPDDRGHPVEASSVTLTPGEPPTGGGEAPRGVYQQWWSGHGPPPDLLVGARPGDMYVDDDADDVYQLR